MIEILLIATPLVLLAAVALLRFNSCSFEPQPAVGVPSNLVAVPGDGQITLTWTGTSDASSFILTRSTPDISGQKVLIPGVTSTSFVDTDVIRGIRFCY